MPDTKELAGQAHELGPPPYDTGQSRERTAMSDIPKCTSWLGHKFQGRYDREPGSARVKVDQVISEDVAEVIRASQKVTYVRDVCVRCGHVIERCNL